MDTVNIPIPAAVSPKSIQSPVSFAWFPDKMKDLENLKKAKGIINLNRTMTFF